jgi:photosystem II stability/assembly factor-like uncharacterized protein
VAGGLPAARTVNGFAVSPADPKAMYVAMRAGLFKSVDGGASWKAVGKGLKNMAAVALNPRRPDEVYAATADGVIFRSADRGTTWNRQK